MRQSSLFGRSHDVELHMCDEAAARIGLGTPEPRSIPQRPFIASRPWGRSKTRQALWTVVRDLDAGHFFERTVWLRGVANQFRCVPVDLVQKRAVRRQPVICRSAGDGCVETSGSAISWNFRACWIDCDFKRFAVDAVAADVAVTEIRREYEPVIRRDGGPAQFRRQARAGVDFRQRADVNVAVSVDRCYRASVPNGISDNECIRAAVQEGDVERRTRLRVLKLARAKRAVSAQGEYDEAVGI